MKKLLLNICIFLLILSPILWMAGMMLAVTFDNWLAGCVVTGLMLGIILVIGWFAVFEETTPGQGPPI